MTWFPELAGELQSGIVSSPIADLRARTSKTMQRLYGIKIATRTLLRCGARCWLESAEFQMLVPGLHRPVHEGQLPLSTPPLAIDTEAKDAQLTAILDRTAMYWQLAGEVLPYQSVVTCDEYRPENFPAAADAFYLTGQQDTKGLSGINRIDFW